MRQRRPTRPTTEANKPRNANCTYRSQTSVDSHTQTHTRAHQRTHSRSSRTPRRKTQERTTIRMWLPLRFLSTVPYTARLRKPFCRVAQTFAFGRANLCLRLRKPSSKVAQVSAAHKPQKPSPQVAQTFASGCANLCLRLRKPLPQVAQTFACVSLLDALLDSEHCVVSQLSCGFRCVVSTHLSLLRSRHPDK